MALKLQKAKDRREESSTGEQQLIHAGISSTEGKAGMSAWKNPGSACPGAPPRQPGPQGELQGQAGEVTKTAGSP